MNFLAHLHLAHVTATSPLGNLLGDFVKGRVPDDLPPALACGIRLHRRVDVFTDAHVEHRTAVAAFEPPWRRFGGVIVDMLYDHLLVRHWDVFNDEALPAFLARNYAQLLAGRVDHAALPGGVPLALRRMAEQDWLSSYGHVEGVQRALDGIGRRLRRPLPLGAALDTLDKTQWAVLEAGFLRFYPELLAFARQQTD